jgi:hypothetical protein
LGFHVRLGRDHPHLHGFHPQRSQKLPHLRRLAGYPGQLFDLGRCFSYPSGWMLLKIGFYRCAVFLQFTLRMIMLDVSQLLNPAPHVRFQIAMEARFGNAAQPKDVTIGDLLTSQVNGLHPHLHPRVGMMKAPIPQRLYVIFAKGYLDHR